MSFDVSALSNILTTLQDRAGSLTPPKLTISHADLPAPKLDLPPIDARIEEALEELRYVKARHIELRSKNLFMETILNTDTENIATSADAGRAEVNLKHDKAKLRSIKAERRSLEEQFEKKVGSYAASSKAYENGKESIERSIRKTKNVISGNDVRAVLGSRDFDKVERLVEHVDDLDARDCDDLVAVLAEERALMQRDTTQKMASNAKLRHNVEKLSGQVNEMEREVDELRSKIDRDNRSNPELLKLRHEAKMQGELLGVLGDILGVQVDGVTENGIAFRISPEAWVKREAGSTVRAPHVLDIAFDEPKQDEYGCEQLTIAHMMLRPDSVKVNDICEEPNVSLESAVHTVCERLMKWMANEMKRAE